LNPSSFIPHGYSPVRPLSERTGSVVFLAINPEGQPCCLKIQSTSRPGALEDLAHLRRLLTPVIASDGFIPLRRWGIEPASNCLWEELELADDSVTGQPYEPRNASVYTPLTLATHVAETGAVPTLQVIQEGTRLAKAVSQLHAAGLFHRDIKPANILLFRGSWVLADYGSVGEAGTSIEFPGTEGYVPPDGLGSPALDVFALGRSLYEAWSGLDRYHFPSLPPGHTQSTDWARHGWQLNKVLLQAGNPRPSERCPSAEDLRVALEKASTGSLQISRRKLLLAAAATAPAIAGFYIWRNLPSHRAVWKKLPPARFGLEHWKGTELSCDWKRRMFYSGKTDVRGILYHAYNLATFTNTERLLPLSGVQGIHAVLSPDGEHLDCLADVSGQIFRIDIASGTLQPLGIHPIRDNAFNGNPYYNPLTKRVGRVFGYGDFKSHARRYELDEPNRRWVEIPQATPIPWPRHSAHCFQSADRRQWYVYGGLGNPSGRQFDTSLGREGYTGEFYEFHDLWRLDLASGRWTQLIPYRGWIPRNLVAAIAHPPTQGVAFLTGTTKDEPSEASIHLWQDGSGQNPIRLPNKGDRISMYRFWSIVREPENSHLWVFANEGVFAVALEAV
jgi:serine/threonine protein kinase